MDIITKEQVRQYRLHAHHLDKFYLQSDVIRIAGACGLQNTPPDAWKNALHNRVPDLSQDDMDLLLENDKTLLQAWSFRGAPFVFPAAESSAFLSALVPAQDEPWIYTRGIQLALDFLQMRFDFVLDLLAQVITGLDSEVLTSKNTLDQVLAERMLPLLPENKRDLWNAPSMYGSPDKQTVGGAAVSFLLRPCSFLGLIVFGERNGISPTFTAYKNWLGRPLETDADPQRKLVAKYLHCFAPAAVGGFADWLGCSPAQARRMWGAVEEEVEPVVLSGKTCYVLSRDKELLISPPQSERTLHLLSGHDPYLGLQDRDVILDDKALQKKIWQTVLNPGAVLLNGEIAGMWKAKKKITALDIEITLWNAATIPKKELLDLCDEYARFQQLKLNKVTFS